MKIAIALAAVLALGAGGAAGARAGEVAHVDTTLEATTFGTGALAAGPVIAGGDVVWAEQDSRQTLRIRAAAPGGAPRTLATLPLVGRPGHDGDDHRLVLLGSPTRLAWFEGVEAVEDGRYQSGRDVMQRVVAGPPDGPFTTVAGCDRTETCGAPPCFGTGTWGDLPWLALDGDVLTMLDHCDADAAHPDSLRKTLRRIDLAASPATRSASPTALTRDDTPVGAAGGLVAVRTFAGPLRAVRGTDGEVVATYAENALTPAYYGSYAMQADGKLAGPYSDPVVGHRQVSWRAPGDAKVHVLRPWLEPADGPTYLAMADDRIAMVGGDDGHRRDLLVTDLAGHETPVVRVPAGSLMRPQGAIQGLALDGTRVAWAATQCERTTFGLSTLDEPPAVIAPAVCAAPRVVSTRALMARDGRFALRVTCGRACHGRVQVTFSGRLKLHEAYAFSGSGRAHRMTFRAPAAIRRRLAHGGVLEVGVTFGVPGTLGAELEVRRLSG